MGLVMYLRGKNIDVPYNYDKGNYPSCKLLVEKLGHV